MLLSKQIVSPEERAFFENFVDCINKFNNLFILVVCWGKLQASKYIFKPAPWYILSIICWGGMYRLSLPPNTFFFVEAYVIPSNIELQVCTSKVIASKDGFSVRANLFVAGRSFSLMKLIGRKWRKYYSSDLMSHDSKLNWYHMVVFPWGVWSSFKIKQKIKSAMSTTGSPEFMQEN